MQKKLYIYVIVILVIAIVLAVFVLMGRETATGLVTADIDVVGKLTELRPDLKNQQPIEVKKLIEPELTKLKQEQPVIYGETEPGDYAIKYNDELIIYSYQNNRIINEFVLQTISIS